jgi:hypothetical protein
MSQDQEKKDGVNVHGKTHVEKMVSNRPRPCSHCRRNAIEMWPCHVTFPALVSITSNPLFEAHSLQTYHPDIIMHTFSLVNIESFQGSVNGCQALYCSLSCHVLAEKPHRLKCGKP